MSNLAYYNFRNYIKHILCLAACLLLSSCCVTKEGKHAQLFPRIEGWSIESHETYDPENLYNPINGAAELFLKYEFVEMQQVDYVSGSNSIDVEIYQHSSPANAFGVYSRERPDRDIYFNIGVQGYKEHDYLHFLAGQYYIKIRANNQEKASLDAMIEIAQKQSEQLNKEAVFPVIFSAFPSEGKVPFSEKYYNSDILGYGFLKHSYEVEYRINEKIFVLFALKADDNEGAKEMLSAYYEYFDLPFNDHGDGYYKVADKYNGDIELIKKDRYLICIRGNIDSALKKEYLERTAKNI